MLSRTQGVDICWPLAPGGAGEARGRRYSRSLTSITFGYKATGPSRAAGSLPTSPATTGDRLYVLISQRLEIAGRFPFAACPLFSRSATRRVDADNGMPLEVGSRFKGSLMRCSTNAKALDLFRLLAPLMTTIISLVLFGSAHCRAGDQPANESVPAGLEVGDRVAL